MVKFDCDLVVNENRKRIIHKAAATVHVYVYSVFVLSEDSVNQQQGFRHIL